MCTHCVDWVCVLYGRSHHCTSTTYCTVERAGNLGVEQSSPWQSALLQRSLLAHSRGSLYFFLLPAVAHFLVSPPFPLRIMEATGLSLPLLGRREIAHRLSLCSRRWRRRRRRRRRKSHLMGNERKEGKGTKETFITVGHWSYKPSRKKISKNYWLFSFKKWFLLSQSLSYAQT